MALELRTDCSGQEAAMTALIQVTVGGGLRWREQIGLTRNDGP